MFVRDNTTKKASSISKRSLFSCTRGVSIKRNLHSHTHAAHAAAHAAHAGVALVVLDVGDHGFGGEHQAGDRGCVL